MIEVTKDLPRSADGLEVPFGPVFPGLPGGLKLTLTLDGDGVTEGQATSLVGMINESEKGKEIDAETFIERLASAMPLASVSYRLLACLAIERAAGLENDSPRQWKTAFGTDARSACIGGSSWANAFAQIAIEGDRHTAIGHWGPEWPRGARC